HHARTVDRLLPDRRPDDLALPLDLARDADVDREQAPGHHFTRLASSVSRKPGSYAAAAAARRAARDVMFRLVMRDEWRGGGGVLLPGSVRLDAAEATRGLEHAVVVRATAGTGEHVDRHIVQRDRDEDLALARREVLLDGVAQHAEALPVLRLLARPDSRRHVGKLRPLRIRAARWEALPGVTGELARHLEDHELV